MLRRFLSWIFFTDADRAVVKESDPGPHNGVDHAAGTRTAQHEGHLDSGAEEDPAEHPGECAGFDEEECDWDEYEDEIASAVAFASLQEAALDEWDEEADIEPELLEVYGSIEEWEDWAAVDEIEDDASYHWSRDEDEEH